MTSAGTSSTVVVPVLTGSVSLTATAGPEVVGDDVLAEVLGVGLEDAADLIADLEQALS